MAPALWEPYLEKFKARFLQEPSETGEAFGAADGDSEEVTLVGRANGAQ